MRISDWSSDVCSSDLKRSQVVGRIAIQPRQIDLDHPPTMGLDALGLALVYSMGHANLDQKLARFVPRVDIGLVGAEPAFQLHLVQRQIGRASCRERVCQYV